MSEQATAAAFPVGTRVRERDWPKGRLLPREGTVVETPRPAPDRVSVWWDDLRLPSCVPEFVPCCDLERIAPPAPPRAPERVLAPGIVQSEEVCDGRPRLDGSGVSTRSTARWPDYAAFVEAHPGIAADLYERGLCFEAGRLWERTRRRRHKERRLVRRYERAKAPAEGKVDDRG